MGELTLKTIMQGFINAENEFPRYIQRRFFSLSDSFPKRSDSNFKVKKAEQKGFFDFWVPEYFTNCFGKAEIGLSDDQIRHISAGRKKKVVETLQSQFENNSVQMFWDYKEHIEKALEWHIKVFICSKNKGLSIFDGENVRITESELTEAIKAKAEEYENTLKAFKNRMLESILQSQEYLSDERIAESEFHGLLTDEKRDEIERLTILSIFGLFSAVTVENEDYYFKRIYKKIYDEKTNELKPLPKTKGKQVRIDREAIWHAGKNWYEQTRIEGNRFSKLFPDTALLPLAGTIPIYVNSTNGQGKKIMDAICETDGHLYLIGEGGIGKTTALYSIMENAFNNSKGTKYPQAPLFIELSRAYKSRDFDLDRGRSEFILNTVQNQLQASLKTTADLEDQIEEEFQKDTEEPEYVLLLDGLNEVSREEIKGHVILQMVVAEIIYIMANYKNVRVILTSRSEEKLGGEAKSLYLSGIDHEQIEAFLNDKEVSPARIKKTTQNTQLMEILRIPLFLIMYSELEGEDELLSRGEILHSFFSKTNKERYSERNRIETINTELAKETGVNRSEGSKDSVTPHMLNFILEFVMPQIAWNMAKENEFQINRTGIKKAVKQVLTDKTETSFISEYGIEFFSEYLTGEDENIRTTAERIKKIFGADGSEGMDSISSGVLKCLTKQFGLLVTNDYKEYEVLHQHIRDYFAALYHINKLKLAAYINEQGDRDEAIECLSEMGKEPLPGQVLVFIGEALGELHNVPELNEETNEWIKKEPEKGTERDLINRSFNIFRDICYDDDSYAVWNLFQILKLVRKDLSGLDLSNLDLRHCRANGYRLGNQSFAAKLDNVILSDEFFLPSGHLGPINSAVFSPDCKRILTASSDGTAKVWDAKTFEEIPTGTLKGFTGRVRSAVFSPDGKHILTTSDDETAKVWDAKTFEEIPTGMSEDFIGSVSSATYSPDGKYILTVYSNGIAKVWDAKTFKEVTSRTLKDHKEIITSCVYSPDGKYFLTTCLYSSDGKHVTLNTEYSPDGRVNVTKTKYGTVDVWDAKTLKRIPSGTLKDHTVTSAIYSPDGKYILTASLFGIVNLLDAETFKLINDVQLRCYTQFFSVGYSPDGRNILIASDYGTVWIWDAENFKEVSSRTFKDLKDIVNSVAYSPDGKYILTAYYDGTTIIWDAKSFNEIPGGTLEGHRRTRISTASYSSDGNNILIAYNDGTAKMWDAKTFKIIPDWTLKGDYERKEVAVYSPDGKYIFMAYDDGTAKLWDAKIFEKLKTGKLKEHTVKSAIYSPDGKYILTVSPHGKAIVWDAKTLKKIRSGKLEVREENILSAIYSPDGEYILAVYLEGTTRVWDAKTLKEIPTGTLKEHKVTSAAYSPDGGKILTAYVDGTIRVWDSKTFIEISSKNLEYFGELLWSVKYSPDGKYILAVYLNETAKVLDAKSFEEKHALKYVPGLEVFNVDLCELNEDSTISDETKMILRDYGASV